MVEQCEALNVFKYFKNLVENEMECSIKVLRTDKGEYNSQERIFVICMGLRDN